MLAAVDHRISAIATPQHGIITRRQLRAAGIDDGGIAYRQRIGRLHRVHRGVYAVGHAPVERHALWMAAVLAGGDGAVLDLYDAAELYGVARRAWRRRRCRISVLTTRKSIAVCDGITFRHTRVLPPTHVTRFNGIPVVTLVRLVVNLAGRETVTIVCKLIDEIAHEHTIDIHDLQDVNDELRNRRQGFGVLVDAIELYQHGERGTDSELEEAGLAFCEAFGLPKPACNVSIRTAGGTYRVDMYWKERRVILEINGGGHARPTRRRRDVRRRTDLTAHGERVFVMTAHDLRDPVARARIGLKLRRALGLER